MSTNIRIHLEYKKKGEKVYRYGGEYTGEWPYGIIQILNGYGRMKPLFPLRGLPVHRVPVPVCTGITKLLTDGNSHIDIGVSYPTTLS